MSNINKKKTVLITGASRGIGKAISKVFSRSEYKLLLPTRKQLDLSSNTSINNYLGKVKDEVDILINNAGINPLADACSFSDDDGKAVLQVNLIAPMKLIKGVLPSMKRRKYGRIVNISSIWSIVSKPNRFIYSSSKSGINGMTRAVSVECAEDNVIVNAVAPGFVNTELTRKNNSKKELKLISKNIPIKRLAEPSEVAELVKFLCSTQNSYITGQTIIIDGGYSCL